MLFNTFMPFAALLPSYAYAEDVETAVEEEVKQDEEATQEESSESEEESQDASTESSKEETLPAETEETPPVESDDTTLASEEEPTEEPSQESEPSIETTDENGVIDPEAATDTRLEEVSEPVDEEKTDEKTYDTLSKDSEVRDTNDSDWNLDEDEKYAETKDKVSIGVKYVFPFDDKVTLTFTKLPSNEEDRSNLKIEKVKISDLNLPDDFNTDSEYAFDITTEMENEEFEYDLTLPKPEGQDVEVAFIEKSLDDAKKEDLKNDDIEKVESDKLSQDNDSDNVKVEELDHFTIYYTISTYAEPTLVTLKTDYSRGETVYAKATRSEAANLRIRFLNPSGNDVKTCNYEYGTETTCELALDNNAAVGEWTAQIGRCDGNCHQHWNWTWGNYANTNFNVLLACNTKADYEKSSDFQDSLVNINFSNSDRQVSISAYAPYTITKVLVDLTTSGNHFYEIPSTSWANYAPSGDSRIDKVKVEVSRLCAVCGDGIVEVPEKCDDGNILDGDFCSSTCEIEHVNINICHATPADTAAQGWNQQSVDDDSIIDGTSGHGTQHAADIIPSFNYYEGTYAGKNLTTMFGNYTGQQILDAGCILPGELEVTKIVVWDGSPDTSKTFQICIQPNIVATAESKVALATSNCQTTDYDGGTLTWNNLQPGLYSIIETDPGTGWVVEITPENQTVSSGQKATATVVNTYDKPEVCGDMIVEGNEQCDDGNQTDSDYCTNRCQINNVCLPDVNMINNGSFENPTVSTPEKWNIYPSNSSGLGWFVEWYSSATNYGGHTRPVTPLLELHRGVNGWNASSGSQYAELDTDWDGPTGTLNNEPASVSVFQNLPTIAGYEYQITYDFSPRPNTNSSNNILQIMLNGNVLDTHTASGGGNTTWETKTNNFVADSTLTKLQFTDKGTPESMGTFLDNVSVTCLGPQTGTISGMKWHDMDTQGDKDENESGVPNWVIFIDLDADKTLDGNEVSTTTDSNGNYTFLNLQPGTYSICEVSQAGWYPTNPTTKCHTGVVVTAGVDTSNINFGNKQIPVYDGDNMCPRGYTESYIETLNISSTNPSPVNYSFDANTSYLLKAKGTYTFNKFSQGAIADAAYGSNNGFSSIRPDIGIWGTNKGVTSILGDLGLGMGVIMWDNDSNLDADHTYESLLTTTNALNASFVISDWYSTWYGDNCKNQSCMPNDNEGSLDIEVYKCLPSSTVEVCKIDNNETPLPGWKVVLRETSPVQSLSVRSHNDSHNGNEVKTSDSLVLGDYVLEGTGLYTYRPGTAGAEYTDSSYSMRHPSDSVYPLANPIPWVNVSQFPGSVSGYLGLMVNSTSTDWGYFSPDHKYFLGKEDHSGTIDFTILDDAYGDNSGSLGVNIYKGWVGVTGNNGCYTFDDVPQGTYYVDEAMKNDWKNVSGIGSLEVNSSEVSHTLVNQLDLPATIIAQKIICDSEEYLPNWGTGGPNITSTTVQNFLNNVNSEGGEHCRVATAWDFQWGYEGVSNPGDNTGPAVSGWNTFSTDDSGFATVEINNVDQKLWAREVWDEAYIPFTFGSNPDNRNNVSAEFYCHQDVLNYDNWDFISNPQYGGTYYCVGFNVLKDGTLEASKTNNKYNVELLHGDKVRYTMKVKALGGPVKDVKLFDLPPEGMTYVAGSYEISSDSRDTGTMASVMPSDPTYASPGEWTLGDMSAGETVTLSYEAQVQDGVDAGIYPDLAWSVGNTSGGDTLLAQSVPSDYEGASSGIVSPVFQGTEVRIGSPAIPDEDSDTEDKEEEEIIEQEGDVLGVSTSSLPATGADWILLVFLAMGLLTGLSMIFVGMRRHLKLFSILFTTILMSGVLSSNTYAITEEMYEEETNTLVVRAEEPVSPSTSTFMLGFVALDTSNKEVEIQCQKKGPSDGDFTTFETQNLQGGGDSGDCTVGASVLTQQGTYSFRVIASTYSESKTSNTVSSSYDSEGPDKPKYIKKDKDNSCKYEVTFRTANDGQTSYVEIYRDFDKDEIEVSPATRIKTINIGSDEKDSFDDTLYGDECSDKPYYAIRAFDASGNYSDVRGEEVVDVTKKYITVDGESSEEETSSAIETIIGSQVFAEGLNEEADVVLQGEDSKDTEDEPSVLGEKSTNGTDDGDDKGDDSSKSFFKTFWFWLLVAILGIGAFYAIRKGRKA